MIAATGAEEEDGKELVPKVRDVDPIRRKTEVSISGEPPAVLRRKIDIWSSSGENQA